jgi:hypothetical protein
MVCCVACAMAHNRRPITPAERSLAADLDRVQYGGEPKVEEAGFTIVRTDGGALRAAKDGRDPEAERPGADDAAIEAALRAKLSRDSNIGGLGIDVDVVRGVVLFSGHIEDGAVAARAVEIALDVRGVVAVESRLGWTRDSDVRLAQRRPAHRVARASGTSE